MNQIIPKRALAFIMLLCLTLGTLTARENQISLKGESLTDRAIYAYDLFHVDTGTKLELFYKLNTPATSVKIKIKTEAGEQVGEIIDGTTLEGQNSIKINVADYPGKNI